MKSFGCLAIIVGVAVLLLPAVLFILKIAVIGFLILFVGAAICALFSFLIDLAQGKA